MAQSAKVRIGEKISWLTDNIKRENKVEAVRRDARVSQSKRREEKGMSLLRRRCEMRVGTKRADFRARVSGCLTNGTGLRLKENNGRADVFVCHTSLGML